MNIKKNENVPLSFKFTENGKMINKKVYGKIGQTLLDVAQKNDIPLEGACDGNLACSTCHIVCDKSLFHNGKFKSKDNCFEEICDKENDLLEKAYNFGENSRLACQVKVDKCLNNKVFDVPRATRNMAVDGYIPPKH